jgi:hypothetical protein
MSGVAVASNSLPVFSTFRNAIAERFAIMSTGGRVGGTG